MSDKAKAMVLASFAADSLALGAHWIYDTQKIKGRFGRVEALLRPEPDSYHPTKDKGEFTHYGDQALALLESVAAVKGFDLNDFSTRWRGLFQDYRGYFDKATKATLANYASGLPPVEAGSASDELGGASRIAPLVFCYQSDLDRLIETAQAQTRMTHNHPEPISAAEFFARVVFLELGGTAPVEAMQLVSEEKFKGSTLCQWVQRGFESKDMDSVSAIAGFGQACSTRRAFPGVVHLVAKYQDDLKEALIQSVMTGGDSAARGMMVGLVLGAHLGLEALPREWTSTLKKRDRIMSLLDSL
ncbi:MAG: ADP-ribosylglycohydrolase family protein [Pseudomonadota bacterium]